MTKKNNNYINNSIWILAEKASRIISGILVGVLVARFLGKEQFGIISYALSVLSIFTVFSTLGLDGIVVRELITEKKKKYEIIGTTFWLRLLGSFVVVFAATYYSFVRDPDDRTWIVFLVSIAVVFQSFSVIDFYFQSEVKGKYNAITQIITLIISAIVKLVLIYLEAPLSWFASMVMLEAVLTAINQLIFYKQNQQEISQWKFSLSEAKRLLSHSWPIIISAFMQMIYQQADKILIARYLQDMGMVGQYSAATRISEASFFIPVALSAALFPGIINNRDNKPLQLKRLTQIYSLMIWSAVFISIGGYLLGDLVIGFLYKDGFPLAPEIFKIHIWITIPVFFGTAWGSWLLALNKQKLITIYQVLVLIFILALEMYMIPKYGIKGAAYSVVFSYILSLLAIIFVYKPKESAVLFISALNPKNLLDVFKYWKEMKRLK
ncbi:MAG: flippase [Bacteroidia bacterium]|nr:flippase [Bacteroidia bacterium]